MKINTLALLVLLSVFSSGAYAAQYAVGRVAGLDSVDNRIIITDMNTGQHQSYKVDDADVLAGLSIGEDVVLSVEKDKVMDMKRLNSAAAVPGIPPHTSTDSMNDPFFDSWDPFESLGRMRRAMRNMMNSSFGTGGRGMFNSAMFYEPDFDFEEFDDKYVVSFDVEDLDRQSLKVDVNKNGITISGQSRSDNEQQSGQGFFKSSSYGSFMKTIPVPSDADIAGQKTEVKENKLIITLPRKNV